MRRIALAILFIASNTASSQVNYVLNPDFEQHTACPTDFNQIKSAQYWSGIDTTITPMGICIPDYCHACATIASSMNVPQGQCYWQHAHSGSAFAQVRVATMDTIGYGYGGAHDYLQGRLYKKLISGKRYCVRMWVSLAESSQHGIADISVYFDNGKIDTTHNCGKAQTAYIPQVVNSSGIITDTANWKKIEGSFVAGGNEQFFTIGNFKDNAHTTYANMPYSDYQSWCDGTVFLIDDVSVIESDLIADAGPDKHVGKGDSIYIGRPKEIGLESTWTILGGSTIIGTGAGIWVKPTTTTTYVVSQTLCGNVKKDTVTVEVWPVGVISLKGQTQQYSLSPNPVDGLIQISQGVEDEGPVRVSIFDATGRLVLTKTAPFKERKLCVEPGAFPSGSYYMVLEDHSGSRYPLRFVKL